MNNPTLNTLTPAQVAAAQNYSYFGYRQWPYKPAVARLTAAFAAPIKNKDGMVLFKPTLKAAGINIEGREFFQAKFWFDMTFGQDKRLSYRPNPAVADFLSKLA